MSRSLIYGLIFFVLFSWIILPRLIDPEKGLTYIVEESLALLLIIVGTVVLRKPVRRLIDRLNTKLPWNLAPLRRLGVELGIVVGAAILITTVTSGPLSLYVNKNGIPPVYVNVLEKKSDTHNRTHPESPEPRDFQQEWTVGDFALGMLEGSAFCFLFLFVVEEAFGFQDRQSKRLLDQQVLLKEQAQLRATVLQKQLDPHFMFNTLNVLSGLIYQDVDRSAQFIKDLSKVYRYVLEQSEELVSTIEQEFRFLQSYIFLLKIRFDDKLHISINMSEDRKDWLIPSMTLELLVENAIKHNVIDHERPLHLVLNVEENYLIVENNLQPRENIKTSVGVGLKNLKKRLELLEQDNYQFSVVGNKYVAVIPLINPDEV